MTMSNEMSTPTYSPVEADESGLGDASGAKEVAKTAADKATDVAGSAVDNAKTVAVEASTQAKAVAAQARDQVQSLAVQTKDELMAQADTKSQQAASGLRTLADQMSALGEGRPADAGQLSHYLGEAEGKVAALATRLERGGPQGVLDDLTSFARRRPGLFLLGAIGAGFVVGRIVRSGTAAAAEDHDASGNGTPVAALPAVAPTPIDRLQPVQ